METDTAQNRAAKCIERHYREASKRSSRCPLRKIINLSYCLSMVQQVETAQPTDFES